MYATFLNDPVYVCVHNSIGFFLLGLGFVCYFILTNIHFISIRVDSEITILFHDS